MYDKDFCVCVCSTLPRRQHITKTFVRTMCAATYALLKENKKPNMFKWKVKTWWIFRFCGIVKRSCKLQEYVGLVEN